MTEAFIKEGIKWYPHALKKVGKMSNYQRNGVASNTQAGRDFEDRAKAFFSAQGLDLQSNFKLIIGINARPKLHGFDLGDENQKVIVECKSHTWTESWNVPSAKMTTWDQAMYFFYAAPQDYRKILFVLRHYNPDRQQTLAEYYVKTKAHLIPDDVEIWEFDEVNNTAQKVRIPV
jgi:hypothetical protein